MRRVRVPVNPEGVNPVAKLDLGDIVLFENSTIAEERAVDEHTVDDSQYHFLFSNPSEIETPRLDMASKISDTMKKCYYLYNTLYFIGVISLLIFFLIENTDFQTTFMDNSDSYMWVYAIVGAVAFTPEILLHLRGQKHYSRIIIQKHARAEPYTLDGKTWKDIVPNRFISAKLVLTWCVLTYYFPWNFDSTGICLGLLGVAYILGYVQQAYSDYKIETIQVKLLTAAEFHEETCKRRVAELEKEPTEIDLRKLIEMDESQTLEFKSSVWASYRSDTGDLVIDANKNYKTEDSIIKTIAGFLNTEGGKLVIGVQERPILRVVGIESDLPYSGGERNIESFQNGLQELIRNSTHSETIVGTYVFIGLEPLQGKKVCVINVKQRQPEKWTWVDMKTIDGGKQAKEVFYVRSGPQTKRISSQESGHEWRSSTSNRRDKWEHWD